MEDYLTAQGQIGIELIITRIHCHKMIFYIGTETIFCLPTSCV